MVNATSSEAGTSATATTVLPVTVTGVADTPNLAVQAATGLEDNAIPLTITTSLATGDNGTLAVVITGVPNGATLSAGIHNQDGSWLLTPAQLQGLTITPPHDYNGSFNLTVTSTSLRKQHDCQHGSDFSGECWCGCRRTIANCKCSYRR